ncbi:MAG: carbohydrate ABC transporter permease [Oscillospiraceae bacterium]|nr:carbohydrate ABC transporter permease [Oscillospiraceae bacterium]
MKGKRKRRASLRLQNLSIGSHVTLCIWSLIVLFPLWTMVTGSFKDKLSIYTNTFGLPETWNWQNYTTTLTERGSNFPTYFLNSFVVVIASLLLVMLFGSLAAYALARWRSRIPTVLYFVFIGGMMLPIKIASVRLIVLMKDLGLLNTIWSLIPVYVAMGLPIAIFVLTEFVRQTPVEMLEAANVDGASPFLTFWRIVVPLLRPALATVAIYNLIPFWNDLWFPLIFISNDKSKTLMLGVTRLFGEFKTDWSRVLAVLTLSAVPVMILYFIFSKQFIKGLTAGGVKG